LFIELSEFLRCPEPHAQTFCVVAPDEMAGRMIARGIVGCPACRREYPIENGVVRFGAAPAEDGAAGVEPPDPDIVQALLGLAGPGGFVVLVGTAARLAGPLAERLAGVHFVGIDAPTDVAPSPALSLLVHPATIPLRDAMARGVMLGAEHAGAPWLAEGTRVLLSGLRLLVVGEDVVAPGLEQLAVGRGLWVGRKQARGTTDRGEG
jgi:uncharacterized protein YbaR (Trm112 family)